MKATTCDRVIACASVHNFLNTKPVVVKFIVLLACIASVEVTICCTVLERVTEAAIKEEIWVAHQALIVPRIEVVARVLRVIAYSSIDI